jgi:hypothetical protein
MAERKLKSEMVQRYERSTWLLHLSLQAQMNCILALSVRVLKYSLQQRRQKPKPPPEPEMNKKS